MKRHRLLRVYLSARISPDAHEWNDTVCAALTQECKIFKPHEHNPTDIPHERLPTYIYRYDLCAMNASDIGLLLPPYGRDCAWEAGWYAGARKPLVIYTETATEWLRDWMVKGGLAAVITTDGQLYERLRTDPIVNAKTLLIPDRTHLAATLKMISKNHRGKRHG